MTARVSLPIYQLNVCQCVLQAPALAFLIPKDFQKAPILTGRAIVEVVVEKANGSSGFVDVENGGTVSKGVFRIALDGYSAPVSAGNFAALVLAGKYDGLPWGSGYASVVAGSGARPGSLIPLEILPIGALSHSNFISSSTKRTVALDVPGFGGIVLPR